MPGTPARRAVGGSYRWTVLAVGTVAQAASSAYVLGLPAVGPALRAGLGLSLPGLGLLLAAPTAGLLATLILWGRASDRLGERAVMAAGLIGTATALAIAPLVHGPVPLGIVLVLAGAAAGSVNAASGRAVLSWFAPARRGLAMGVRQTAVPLGAAAGAAALPPIVRGYGLPAVFVALAALCLAAAVAAWAWIREPTAVAPAAREPGRGPVASVLRDPRLVRLSAASALLVVPQFVVVAFTVELLRERGGLSPGSAAVVLAVAQGVGAAGRLIAGWWSDRVGSRLRPLRTVALLIAAGFAVLALTTNGWSAGVPLAVLVAVVVAVAGVVICWNGLAFTATGELAPPGRTGTALGVQNTACFAAATLTPPLAGTAITLTGWPVTLALLMVPALVAARLLTPLVRAEPMSPPVRAEPTSPPVGGELARTEDSAPPTFSYRGNHATVSRRTP